MKDQHVYLLALALTKGLGPVTVKNLIAYCGSAQAVLKSTSAKLRQTPGVGRNAIHLVKKAQNLGRAQQELAFAEREGVKVMSYLDEDYPHALKYIYNAPLFLFQKGNVTLNAQPNIAIVGTRRASIYGKEIATHFANRFAKEGLNIVSGLAYGIDIAAHKAALTAGGTTTAVLAHGLDMIYPPTHLPKAKAMLHKGGWVTEYLTGSEPDAMHFPARNRIIAGICQSVVVVEATQKGGALITARFAQEQNREVYAIPGRIGDPFSIGCNRLIRDHGAKLVTDPQEVIDDLMIHWQGDIDKNQEEQLELALSAPEIPITDEEARILNILQKGESGFDGLIQRTGISAGRLQSLLLTMEFKDLLRQMPGKRFEKK